MASNTASISVDVRTSVDGDLRRLARQLLREAADYDPAWLNVVCDALRHQPYVLTVGGGDQLDGLLPLSLMKSFLFGRFLVSLPYVNTGGVIARKGAVAAALIDRAVELADELDVRYLELRHEKQIEHPALAHRLTSKVHMRLALPSSADELWKQFKPKVRNQIRKGERHEFAVTFGGEDLLSDFYEVFVRNMRDLGTPVFGRDLFARILAEFPGDAEFCVLRLDSRPIAAGLLVHRRGITEVPSASSLRSHNSTNANMLMYWRLLRRAIERRQGTFDFGRSSLDSNTFRFKKQWGAKPVPAVWQYYVRKGDFQEMRRETGKFDRLIGLWRKMPLGLTKLIGPTIVRGIP